MSTPRSLGPRAEKALWRWAGVLLVWGALVSKSTPRSPGPCAEEALWCWAGVRLVYGALVSKSYPPATRTLSRGPRGAGQGGGFVALGRGAPGLWYTGFYEYPMIPRTLNRGGLVVLRSSAPGLGYTGFYEFPMVPRTLSRGPRGSDQWCTWSVVHWFL
ncbi:hypothetical protein NDU88_008997 [Pleurodeles waltl]|uniref:Uncharacterized protein n=1 Tax=Pleurodeles waltl TaxID=8319 RepID=A0AAV7NFU2_PLEWA|nr:hypothetical protein NDU88_008997 [Pleurodeles waltl]